MTRFVSIGTTGALALLLCSCASNAELDKVRADAAAAKADAAHAKAEVEALKTQLAKVRADAEAKAEATRKAAEKEKADDDAAKEKAKKDFDELVKRWNAVAADMAFELPWFNNTTMTATFTWDGERFPHPTFKMGTAEAYAAFAKVLLAFLEKGDNFAFLEKNGLFKTNLRSGVPGPSGPDAGWNLAELVNQFSTPGGLGNTDEAVRKALEKYSERIQSALKGTGKL